MRGTHQQVLQKKPASAGFFHKMHKYATGYIRLQLEAVSGQLIMKLPVLTQIYN